MPGPTLIMTTLPDMADAEALAEQLVESRQAACINILPKMTSVYRWDNQLQKGEEHLLLIKTREELCEPLISEIKKQHPYELPEIIAVPISTGLPAYLEWIIESTNK